MTQDIARLRELSERGKKGPWTPGNSTISWWIDAPSDKSRCWISGHLGADTWHDKEARQRALADRDLIIASVAFVRDDLPALLAQLEAAKTLATAVKNILPIGDPSKPDSAAFPIYVRMSELRALHALARGGEAGE